MIARLRALWRDRRGITMVEFGLIAPAMCLMLLALGDLLHRGYVQSILDGEMQKAGRDSAIEGGPQNAEVIDNRVRAMVKLVAKEGTIETSRENYSTFQSIKPERFDDTNGNGARDPGECFDDINANARWDAKPSRRGQGGAGDVTIYRATLKFPRLFPLGGLMGWDPIQTVNSETLLKNQPFAAQSIGAPEAVCT